MDIHAFYKPFLLFFRKKRIARLYNHVAAVNATTVLDVGGTLGFWDIVAECGYKPLCMTIVNVHPPGVTVPDFITWITTEGGPLPFEDNSFDIVLCNSVIEHLADWDTQVTFAREIQRVDSHHFVQTPNRYFPIDPHIITPFIHWFPKSIQKYLLHNFTVWGWFTRPSPKEVAEFLHKLRLLSVKEMKMLFPQSTLIRERFGGMTKSILCVK